MIALFFYISFIFRCLLDFALNFIHMLCEWLPNLPSILPLARSACVGLEPLQHVIIREKVPTSQQIQVALFGGVYILNQLYKEMSVDVSLDWQPGAKKTSCYWGGSQGKVLILYSKSLNLGLLLAVPLLVVKKINNGSTVCPCCSIWPAIEMHPMWSVAQRFTSGFVLGSRLHSQSLIDACVFVVCWLLDTCRLGNFSQVSAGIFLKVLPSYDRLCDPYDLAQQYSRHRERLYI